MRPKMIKKKSIKRTGRIKINNEMPERELILSRRLLERTVLSRMAGRRPADDREGERSP